MPLFLYACPSCNHTIKKFIRLVANAPALVVCDKCSANMKKQLSSPASVSKISIDNGVQARAVEIIPNIIELNEERSNKNYHEED